MGDKRGKMRVFKFRKWRHENGAMGDSDEEGADLRPDVLWGYILGARQASGSAARLSVQLGSAGWRLEVGKRW